jgi:hypothetical protein
MDKILIDIKDKSKAHIVIPQLSENAQLKHSAFSYRQSA